MTFSEINTWQHKPEGPIPVPELSDSDMGKIEFDKKRPPLDTGSLEHPNEIDYFGLGDQDPISVDTVSGVSERVPYGITQTNVNLEAIKAATAAEINEAEAAQDALKKLEAMAARNVIDKDRETPVEPNHGKVSHPNSSHSDPSGIFAHRDEMRRIRGEYPGVHPQEQRNR